MGYWMDGVKDNQEAVAVLVEAGLSKQQAESVTAKKMMEMFAKDSKIGIDVLNAMVQDLTRQVDDCKAYLSKAQKVNERAEELTEQIRSFHDITSEMTDDRAKNGIMLYSAIMQLSMSQCGAGIGATEQILANAGYALHAYFGGQARRTYFLAGGSKKQTEDDLYKDGNWKPAKSNYNKTNRDDIPFIQKCEERRR